MLYLYDLNVIQLNLQMAFLFISSEAEKYFINLESIGVASTFGKHKLQAVNFLDIATIDMTYLNKHFVHSLH